MSKVKLYIARHGKTMFNTIGRAQGWSDSPLTPFGEEGIRELGVGLKAAGIPFKAAYSSDSGRTIQTMDIILRETGLETIPYKRDKRIREWCFGSLDGGYDGELFYGVLPRTDAFQGKDLHEVTYPELAQGILDVDTAGWAEPWEVLRKRILEGFTAIAEDLERSGGGNAIVVSHGMTIATFAWLIDPSVEHPSLDNGSVTVVAYENGKFTLEALGDMTYRQVGREIIEKENGNCKQQEVSCLRRVDHPGYKSPYLSFQDHGRFQAEHTQHTGINIHQKISQHIANHHIHSKVRNSVSSILSFQFINPIHKLTQSPFLFIDRALKIFLF